MHKWVYFFITSVLVVFAGSLLLTRMNVAPAISYFPIDNETDFNYAMSELKLIPQKETHTYKISWLSESETEKPVYLRQDASLLFKNGNLIGVRSKWEQDIADIQLSEQYNGMESNLFQTLSVHHGEIHYSDDEIRSIQQMTYDELYVIDSNKKVHHSFKAPGSDVERKWKKSLEHTTKRQLLQRWQRLTSHFKINMELYDVVPLTELHKYSNEPLPSFSQDQTNQIIGQLWEGLYKNYIIPAAKTKENKMRSYIPIILFDKQNKHLLVLFELNGNKEKLIQQYPAF